MVLREVREEDVPTLARLYADSVRTLAPGRYTAEAVEAWASRAERAAFRDLVVIPRTLVVEDETGIVGFGGLDPSGHVASMYVRGDRSREGIGSLLLSRLLEAGEDAGMRRFTVDASLVARSLFERHGFSIVATEVVEREGVDIARLRMEKRLPSRPSADEGRVT